MNSWMLLQDDTTTLPNGKTGYTLWNNGAPHSTGGDHIMMSISTEKELIGMGNYYPDAKAYAACRK